MNGSPEDGQIPLGIRHQHSIVSMLNLAQGNLKTMTDLRNEGKVCVSQVMQVKNLLKELIHDGIEPSLLDGLLETYKRNLAGDSANSE